MARSERASLLLALSLLGGEAAGAEGLYLHVIPTAVRAGVTIDAKAPLRVAAYGARPASLAATLPGSQVHADHVELELGAYPQLEPSDPQRFLAESFVVDFAEPAVVALRNELVREQGQAPSPEALRRFVAEAITEKTNARGWDLASRVAASRSGDCTEHAVLLAALARSLGRPARVALGVVLVETEAGYGTFGHAWTELHEAGAWRVLDATLEADSGVSAGYLPLGLVSDEGPGYGVALAQVAQQTWISRLEILGNAEP